MISRERARESKDKVRSKLTKLGFTVVSLGLRKLDENWIIEAGILQNPDEQKDLEVNDIPVRLRQQTKPRFQM